MFPPSPIVIAAVLLLKQKHACLAHQGTPSGVVEDVVVSGAVQSRGIGRRMMAFARERCVARGCYKMALSSNLKRERAHQFYEEIGFEKHGYSFRINP